MGTGTGRSDAPLCHLSDKEQRADEMEMAVYNVKFRVSPNED